MFAHSSLICVGQSFVKMPKSERFTSLARHLAQEVCYADSDSQVCMM